MFVQRVRVEMIEKIKKRKAQKQYFLEIFDRFPLK
jgi:hypothetical protein